MCNPLMIGLAAQGAGAIMQNSATRRSEGEKARLGQAQSERTRDREKEARDALGVSTTAMDRGNFDQGAAAAATDLANLFRANTGAAPGMNMSPNSPQIVQDAMAEAFKFAEAKNEEANVKLANLQSVNDYLKTTINPQLNKSGQVGTMMGGFIKGNVAPYEQELEAANRLAYSPMAQLLSGAGRAGMNYGLYKA